MIFGNGLLSSRNATHGSGSGVSSSNVYLEDGNIIYERVSSDNIFIDLDDKVYYSAKDKNSKIFADAEGKVFAKKVDKE